MHFKYFPYCKSIAILCGIFKSDFKEEELKFSKTEEFSQVRELQNADWFPNKWFIHYVSMCLSFIKG